MTRSAPREPRTLNPKPSLHPREIPQDLQPDLLALLRVELGGHHVVPPDTAGERPAVVGRRGDDRRVLRGDVVAVDEVDAAPFGQVAQDRALTLDVERVP